MYRVNIKKFENTDKFRPAAIHFEKYGYYCAAPKGTSAYKEYWDEEIKRCLKGFKIEDGDYISGYHYFYLNYCQISRIVKDELTGKAIKKNWFPRFFDYDYEFFIVIDQCEKLGKHLAVLKARRKGYSYKVAAMLVRNFYLIPNSKSYAYASEAEFLTKDGILSKAWEYLDFIDENTAWYKKRQKIDRTMHKRASFVVDKEGVKVELGYKSEIIGVTLKNDVQKIRGKGAKLIIFEEAGNFPDLKTAWQIARPSVEQGGDVHGLMIAFGTGGCVCAGTKVWTKDGKLINIEDLEQEDGILGYNHSYNEVSKEGISWMQPPTKKECYKITTNTGRQLECSLDHPILTALQDRGTFGNILGQTFIETKDLKINNKIAVIDTIPIFGNSIIWESRLIGWLIGDGSYGNKQTPTLSNCEEEINDWIEEYMDTSNQLQRLTKDNKIYKETNIRNIIPKLRELGIYGQTKLNKTLPKNIDSYSMSSLSELIGGLFDTDGYINLRYNKERNTPIAEISISQASLNLLEEIRFLLQKFGVHGRIRKRLPRENNPKDRNPWYEFVISDKKSLIRFADNIVLYPKEKQKRLNKIKEVFSNIKAHIDYNGIRWEKIIKIENIGIKDIYNLTADSTHTYLANGIITHNTKDADFEGLKDLFYEPKGYNCFPIENIWDDGATGPCGFFVPDYYNLDNDHMDENGNSLVKEAIKTIMAERQRIIDSATDRTAVDRYIAEHCFNPLEATLQISSNIFPKNDLIKHLAYIRNNKKVQEYKQVGDLFTKENGSLSWEQSLRPKDLIKYRLQIDTDPTGEIVIWEHPILNPPNGLYIAGCLTPGEKVITDKGLKNVEDITLDDKLVNKEGQWVDINTLLRYNKVEEPTFKIHMSNVDRPTNYTQEHPLYLSETFNGEYSFMEVKYAKEGMWNKYPNFYNKEKELPLELWDKYKPQRNNEDTNPMLDEDFWWFVGHWLGDGFNHKQGNNYTIYNSFGLEEGEYVIKYKDIVTRIFHRHPHLKLQNGSNTHKFEYKQLFLFLEENFGKYANGKFISEWVKFIPTNLKLQLILGYLDSDGSVFKDRSLIRASFKSINRKLLNDIQDILFSLGIISKFNLNGLPQDYNINGKIGKTQQSYSLQIGKVELKKLADKYIFDFNSRKLRLAKEIVLLQKPRENNICIISEDNNYIFIKIKKIEESSYTGLVYNFDCETHTFVTQYCTGHNCDPYDHDQSNSGSLGSILVYKRFQKFDTTYDILVAEYTGRPKTAEMFYEKVRRLLTYYNAKLLFENQNPGLLSYFRQKHCDYLLADQPDILDKIIKKSTVERSKGNHMNKEIKLYCEGITKDWLIEDRGDGRLGLHTILSEPLLEELIAYSPEGNFDRVIAFFEVMLYKEELYDLKIKDNRTENKKISFFSKPLFLENIIK